MSSVLRAYLVCCLSHIKPRQSAFLIRGGWGSRTPCWTWWQWIYSGTHPELSSRVRLWVKFTLPGVSSAHYSLSRAAVIVRGPQLGQSCSSSCKTSWDNGHDECRCTAGVFWIAPTTHGIWIVFAVNWTIQWSHCSALLYLQWVYSVVQKHVTPFLILCVFKSNIQIWSLWILVLNKYNLITNNHITFSSAFFI